ncbi:MAG: EamA family transporter [Clostridia bacterium]|nr:EamA family transporter [Clostridia bacterium]
MKKQRIAMLEMLLCACLWSIAGIFIKLIPWNPLVIAGFRSLFSALTVLVFMATTRQRIFFNKKIAISAFFLAATFLCFVGANKLTTSANAIVLQFTAPIFIMLFGAVFRKEKFSKLDIATVIITLGGIALFAIDGISGGRALGNLVGLLAGLFMAGMYITVGDGRGPERMNGLLFGHLLTALIGLPFILPTQPVFTAKAWCAVIILGVVQLGIPYILLALASEHCPPLACSLISAAEPLLNPVWVAIFAGEYPSPLALIGGVIVISVITVWCILKDKRGCKKT